MKAQSYSDFAAEFLARYCFVVRMVLLIACLVRVTRVDVCVANTSTLVTFVLNKRSKVP